MDMFLAVYRSCGMNGIVAVVRIDLTDKQVICIHYTQFIHSRNEELCATSLREEYLYKVFGTFPHERVIFSLPCLYLFSHLWLKGIMDFFLYTEDYDPIQIVLVLAIGSSFSSHLSPVSLSS